MNMISKAPMYVFAALNTTAMAGVNDDRKALNDVPVGTLKEAYLSCERASSEGFLGGADAMRCSVIYEALKARAFDGDFQRLLLWSQAQRAKQMPQIRTRDD